MDELIAAILSTIAELLFEAFLEFVAAAILDLIYRVMVDVFKGLAELMQESRVLACFVYGMSGLLAGAVSIIVLPHRLIRPTHPVGFHGISLLTSPVIAGLAMSAIGSMRQRSGRRATPIETFGYGFAFALGMALIRLLFVK